MKTQFNLIGTIEIQGVDGELWFIETSQRGGFRLHSSFGYDTLNADECINDLETAIKTAKTLILETQKAAKSSLFTINIRGNGKLFWATSTIEGLSEELIDFAKVHALYPGCKIVAVESYYKPKMGWSEGPIFKEARKAKEGVLLCISNYAQCVQLDVFHEGKHCYPDYKVYELVKQNSTLKDVLVSLYNNR